MELLGLGLRVDSTGVEQGVNRLNKLGGAGTRAERGLHDTEQQSLRTTKGVNALAGAAKAAGGALVAMVSVQAIKSQIDYADKLHKTNIRIGAGVKALSEYNHVADLSGVSMQALTNSWQRQTRRIGEAAKGTGAAKDALEDLNLSAKNMAQLAPEDQFEKIATAMQGVATDSEKAALAQNLWGREGVELLQIVNSGADGIAEMRKEAQKLGLSLSQDAVDSAAEFNDEMTRLSAAAEGAGRAFLIELLPAVTDAVEGLNDLIDEAGGAERILDTIKGAAKAAAILMAGRYVGAMTSSTTATGLYTAATKLASGATATLTGRMTAQTAVARTAAGASRGAAAAIGLLGGPVGAAVVAAGAIYTFREELGLVPSSADTAVDRVEKLTDSFDANSRAAIKNKQALLEAEQQYSQFAAAALAVEAQAQQRTILEKKGVVQASPTDTGARADLEQARIELEKIKERMGDASDAADLAGEHMEKLGKKLDKIGERGGNAGDGVNQSSEALEELREELDATYKAQKQYTETVEKLDKQLEEGELKQEEYNHLKKLAKERLDKATKSTKANTKATDAAAKATKKQASELENLRRRLDPAYARSQDLAKSTAMLDKALATGAITLTEYLDLWDKAAEVMIDARDTSDDTADDINDNTDEMADLFERSMERWDDASVAMWRSFLDGSEDAFSSFKNLALDTLAEVIHQYTTRQITANIGGDFSFGGGGAGGAGGAGGFDFNPSMIKSGYDKISGWLGGGVGANSAAQGYAGAGWAGSATSGGGGWYGSATASGASGGAGAGGMGAGGTMGGLYTAGAGLAGSYVGGEVAGGFTSKEANSNYGATIGTTAGAYIGSIVPVVGTALGAAIGGALGSAVDTVTGSKDTPLRLSLARGEDYDSHEWDHGITAESGLGQVGLEVGSHKVLDKWDKDEAQEIVDAVASVDDAMASLAKTPEQLDKMKEIVLNENEFGIEGHYGDWKDPEDIFNVLLSHTTEALGALDLAFDQAMRDFDGNAAERVNFAATLSAIEDQIDGFGGTVEQDIAEELDRYKGSDRFEDAAIAMQKAAGAMNLLDSGSERLSLKFDTTAKSAIHAASKLQAMVGGVDNLAAMQSEYYDKFYTGAEKAAHLQEDLTEALESQNLELPKNKAAYRELVEAQDLNTEAGRENYAVLLDLAGGFDRLAGSAGGASDSINEMAAAISKREALENQLLQIQGDTEALREQELDGLRELEGWKEQGLVSLQERIWALKDEQEAAREAEKASRDRAREMERAEKSYGRFTSKISEWLDSQRLDRAGPQGAQQAAGAQFRRELSAAQSGDRDALSGITGYADRLIESATASARTRGEAEDIRSRVMGQIADLPDQVSAEQFLADEIKGAVEDQTGSVSEDIDTLGDALGSDIGGAVGAMTSGFGDLDKNLDGKLTFDELKKGLDGKATDEQIRALIAASDLNSDGVISKLESVVVADMPTDALLANIVAGKLDEVEGGQLTHAQVREALSPIATDAEIDRFIQQADKNSDGILSKQEIANAQLSGLSSSIAGNLSGFFGDLDENLDGKLTFDELKEGLDGIATDAQINALIAATDLNSDGVINKLESVVVAEMPSDALLANIVAGKLDTVDGNQLTSEQVHEALSPVASKAVINRLINRADKNADGIISKQEVANTRLGGLVDGFAGAMLPMFDELDLDMSGAIDFSEFTSAFDGVASDAELRNIFNKLSVDGRITKERLNSIKNSSGTSASSVVTIEDFLAKGFDGTHGLSVSLARSHHAEGLRDIGYNIAKQIEETGWKPSGGDNSGSSGASSGSSNKPSGGGSSTAVPDDGDTGSSAGDKPSGKPSGAQRWLDQLNRYAADLYGPQRASVAADIYRQYPKSGFNSHAYWGGRALDELRKLGATLPDRNRDIPGHKFFASGGYTGAGGAFEPAGTVHKGEVVWSQSDIARAGGVSAVESMRTMSAQDWQRPAAVTPSMGGNAGGGQMVAMAVNQMRGEMNQLLRGIMSSTKETASLLDDWDAVGQPTFRQVGENSTGGSLLTV